MVRNTHCVQMNVDGTDTGYFCLWLQTVPNVMTNCSNVRPFGQPATKPSVEGGMTDVCSLSYASCEAYDYMIESLPCDTGEHDDCGIVGLDDGRCDVLFCSIRCNVAKDCLDGDLCIDNICDA